jgi:hypothetical protein
VPDDFDLDVRFGEPVQPAIGVPTTETIHESHVNTCGGACCARSFSCL